MCWSGGKDSSLSLWELRRQDRWDIRALLTTVTRDYDRISMHGVRRTLLHQQAESLGLPLHEVFITPRADNSKYEQAMANALLPLREQGVRHIAFGDIFLQDLKEYRQTQMGLIDMECVFPIWQRDTTELATTFIDNGFGGITTCVDPKKLGERHVGCRIDHEFLNSLPETVDPCGENGEFHSFVFDGPIFQDSIPFSIGEKVERDSFLFCDLVSV